MKALFACVGLGAVVCALHSEGVEAGTAGFLRFPKGFDWCVATSAHQIEGENRSSDWAEWEDAGRVFNREKSGRAAGHWDPADEEGRLKADTALIRALHAGVYRFSVEWAKLEPAEGRFDGAAFEHYRKELKILRDSGIRPFITLNHFTLPLWVSKKGGWEWAGIPGAFRGLTEKIYAELGSGVRDWVTINEPMAVIALGYFHYVEPAFPPGKHDPKAAHRAMRNMLLAHREAYRALHALAKKAGQSVRVGLAYHFRIFDPENGNNPVERFLASTVDWFANWSFVNAVETGELFFNVWPEIRWEKIAGLAGTEDFIGVNYYTRNFVGQHTDQNHFDLAGRQADVSTEGWDGAVTDTAWQIYPEGMYRVLKRIHQKYRGKRIYITENGIADAVDSRRPRFFLDHLVQVHRAIQEGVRVDGYCHWSLMDNFEWSMGFGPRFGLFAVDYLTLERIPRLSAKLFQRVAFENGFLYPTPGGLPDAMFAELAERHFVR